MKEPVVGIRFGIRRDLSERTSRAILLPHEKEALPGAAAFRLTRFVHALG